MQVIKVADSPAERDYHGCGKAWAALDADGKPVALRYMGDFAGGALMADERFPVRALAYQHCDGLTAALCPTFHSSKSKSAFLDAAIGAGHVKPGLSRGYGHQKLAALLHADMAAAEGLERKEFGVYRVKCCAELAKLGRVVSGELSCYEFIIR